MYLIRSNDGIWSIRREAIEQAEQEESHPTYLEALPRYMTAFDPAFTRARETSEFEFLFSLLRIRGMQDAGWDPYETTLKAIPALVEVHKQIQDFESARHLQLWIYGHVIEASEPYEILANLIDVSTGGRFHGNRFPPRRGGHQQSPGEKIDQIEKAATSAGMPQVAIPIREAWNRDFRNAIFHSDYSLHGDEVRTFRPVRKLTHEDVMTLVNRALAYHDALAKLYQAHISSYEEPKVIDVHPEVSGDPEEKAVVIVREGYGAVGIKDAWTLEQIQAGKITFRTGRFSQEEINLMRDDPTLALLPSRPTANVAT